MTDIAFVGTGPYYRLPEVMARPGLRISVVGDPRHPLRRSRFVDRFVPLALDPGEELADALVRRPDVLAGMDWVVIGDDPTLRRIATSDLPKEDKLRILPVRDPVALTLPGSKVGLDALCRLAGVATPLTRVAACPADLPGLVAEVSAVAGRDGPALVKADEGWGGDHVVLCGPDGDPPAIPDAWFPVVVQEFVAGPRAGVDALFRDGRLVGWTYSLVRESTSEAGPSVTRVFGPPPADDLLADLDRVGRVGRLHGFYNVSFVWSPTRRRHLMFELDGRPNAWFQFGPALGVDWARQMTVDDPGTAAPRLAPGARPVVRMFPRSVISGLERRDLAAVRPWLLALPGTWDTCNVRDGAVNAVDVGDTVRALRRWAWLTALIVASRTRQSIERGSSSPRDRAARRGRASGQALLRARRRALRRLSARRSSSESPPQTPAS